MNVTQVNYEITEVKEGVYLKIWEPADSGRATQPYSFMANYTLNTVMEAQSVLQRYCSTGINVVLQQSVG
ncbi:MAG: hypothetical protein AAFZ80_06875 [Cyanobacteria bacterium P01_A01_bin.105]